MHTIIKPTIRDIHIPHLINLIAPPRNHLGERRTLELHIQQNPPGHLDVWTSLPALGAGEGGVAKVVRRVDVADDFFLLEGDGGGGVGDAAVVAGDGLPDFELVRGVLAPAFADGHCEEVVEERSCGMVSEGTSTRVEDEAGPLG